MHFQIHSAAQALTEADGILGSGRRVDQEGAPRTPSAGMWESYAVSPLAAILLATARANAGLVDVATVLDVVLARLALIVFQQALEHWLDTVPEPHFSECVTRAAADLQDALLHGGVLPAPDAIQ